MNMSMCRVVVTWSTHAGIMATIWTTVRLVDCWPRIFRVNNLYKFSVLGHASEAASHRPMHTKTIISIRKNIHSPNRNSGRLMGGQQPSTNKKGRPCSCTDINQYNSMNTDVITAPEGWPSIFRP